MKTYYRKYDEKLYYAFKHWAMSIGRSENHKNELGICPECYYYVLVYYKTGFEEEKMSF